MRSWEQLRTDLRRDLRDEDPTAYLWTDAALDRHLTQALTLLEAYAPAWASLDLSAGAGQRRYDLTSLAADWLWAERVEAPPDAWPPAVRPFREEPGPTLVLRGPLPAPGETLRLWYARRYRFTPTGSDLPPALEELLLLGAGAYALLDRAALAITQVGPGGQAPADYRALGEARLNAFLTRLLTLTPGGGPATGWPLADE